MKTLISIYLIGYTITIFIACKRHLKHEGVNTMIVISSVYLFVYPFILIAILIERIRKLIITSK